MSWRKLASGGLAAGAFLILALGLPGVISEGTGKPPKPNAASFAVALIVIVALTALLGWAAWRLWRSGRQAAEPDNPADLPGGRSAGRILASALLWLVTADLLAIGVAGVVSTVSGTGGSDSSGGLVFVFLVALLTGSGARAVAKGGRDVPATPWPTWTGPESGSAGSQFAETRFSTAQLDQARLDQAQLDQAQLGEDRPGQPPANAAARYTERCSQLLLRPFLIGLVLLAGCVAGAAAAGGQGAVSGIGLTIAILTGFYLALVLIDLPNGIVITGGRFTVGVRAVPPAGRMWRRISGPLDAVYSWQVQDEPRLDRQQRRAAARQRRATFRQRRAAGRTLQNLGDLRMFGRRRYLRLVVDPAAVRARLPAQIMVGYVFVPAASAGAVWNGVILIGTRRPAALAVALEQALPGRPARGVAEQRLDAGSGPGW